MSQHASDARCSKVRVPDDVHLSSAGLVSAWKGATSIAAIPRGVPLWRFVSLGVLALEMPSPQTLYLAGRKLRSLRELLTTETELRAMAPAAHMGFRKMPNSG